MQCSVLLGNISQSLNFATPLQAQCMRRENAATRVTLRKCLHPGGGPCTRNATNSRRSYRHYKYLLGTYVQNAMLYSVRDYTIDVRIPDLAANHAFDEAVKGVASVLNFAAHPIDRL